MYYYRRVYSFLKTAAGKLFVFSGNYYKYDVVVSPLLYYYQGMAF